MSKPQQAGCHLFTALVNKPQRLPQSSPKKYRDDSMFCTLYREFFSLLNMHGDHGFAELVFLLESR